MSGINQFVFDDFEECASCGHRARAHAGSYDPLSWKPSGGCAARLQCSSCETGTHACPCSKFVRKGRIERLYDTPEPPIMSDDPWRLRDPELHGPVMICCMDDEEGGTWTGPHASVEEALRAFLDDNDPLDDTMLYVRLGRPLTLPLLRGGSLADQLYDAFGDSEEYPEGAAEPFRKLSKEDEASLADAVNIEITAWAEARPRYSLAGWWRTYGRGVDTTAAEARERLGLANRAESET